MKNFVLVAAVALAAALALVTAAGSRVPKAPDLVDASIGKAPAHAAPGLRFTLMNVVANRGAARARPSVTRFSLRSGTTSRLAGLRRTPALKPHQSVRARVRLQVPATAPAASYALIACVDATHAVKEADERDNCRTARARLQVQPPPAPQPAPAPTPSPGATDSDRDGTPDTADCAPQDASIHPGATDTPDLEVRRLELRRDRRRRGQVDLRRAGRQGHESRHAQPAEGHRRRRRRHGGPVRLRGAGRRRHLRRGRGRRALDNVGIYGGYAPSSWSRSSSNATVISGSPQAVFADGVRGVTLQLLTLRSGTAGQSRGRIDLRRPRDQPLQARDRAVDPPGRRRARRCPRPRRSRRRQRGSGQAGADGDDDETALTPRAGQAERPSRHGCGRGARRTRRAPNDDARSGPRSRPGRRRRRSTARAAPGIPEDGQPGSNGADGSRVACPAPAARGDRSRRSRSGAVTTEPTERRASREAAAAGAGAEAARTASSALDGNGSGGGGGGAGGGAGSGGSGGQAGGGSFGVYLRDSEVHLSAGTTIRVGAGGAGGAGGRCGHRRVRRPRRPGGRRRSRAARSAAAATAGEAASAPTAARAAAARAGPRSASSSSERARPTSTRESRSCPEPAGAAAPVEPGGTRRTERLLGRGVRGLVTFFLTAATKPVRWRGMESSRDAGRLRRRSS